MSRSQDYIAKIRYQNTLPPPALPPKLLDYGVPEVQQIQSSSLLSSLFRKESINNLIAIDNDLGSPIDLVAIPYIFDQSDEQSNKELTKLDEKDRFLLRDPGIDKAVKSEPNVAFLRRTEYTISTSKPTPKLQSPAGSHISSNIKSTKSSIDTQLHNIESGFDESTKTLQNPKLIKHPLKKNLKAKKIWTLLPDVSRMDQTFSTIRFANNRTKNSKLLETSILRRFRLNNEIDWVSFYNAENESISDDVKAKIQNLNESLKLDEDEADLTFKYLKEGDYELQFNSRYQSDEGLSEIALRFDDKDNIVYYNPIQAKGELKRRKLQDSLQNLYDKFDLDEIDVKFKEPTVDELNQRNSKRHKFDDVTYESIDKIEEEKLEYEEPKEIDDKFNQEQDDLELIRRQNSEV